MLARYMTLSLADRKTVGEVVAALALAATVKGRNLQEISPAQPTVAIARRAKHPDPRSR